MFNKGSLDYFSNTIIALLAAVLLLVPFYLILGNTSLLWSAVLVIGMPHFIFGSLGYLAANPKKLIGPFIIAAVFGLIISMFHLRLPSEFASLFFLIYFVIHLLSDEQMFEATIVKGKYKIWQNSWSTSISWGSIGLVIIGLAIAAFWQLSTGILIMGFLWLLLAGVILFLLKNIYTLFRKQEHMPWGFLTFMTLVLLPGILVFSFLAKGSFVLPVLLGLFHFASWYVFYSKRLLKYPKEGESGSFLPEALFGWRKNFKRFWFFVLGLQGLWILFFFYHLFSGETHLNFLVAGTWAPFWTIIHVTTSFLPNRPVEVKLKPFDFLKRSVYLRLRKLAF